MESTRYVLLICQVIVCLRTPLSYYFCQVIQTKYTIGMEHEEVPASVEIVRDKLTRSLPAILPDVIDELKVAVGDYMPAQGDGDYSIRL